jgi:hypothetical protein
MQTVLGIEIIRQEYYCMFKTNDLHKNRLQSNNHDTVERDLERLTLVMGRRRKKYVIWPKNLVLQTKHLTCRNSNTIGTLILLNPFAPTPPRSIPAKNN